MNEILVKPGVTIDLGKRGENMARCAVFDVSAWQKTYGEGTVHLLHQRNGDKEPYPCVIEVEGGNVYWPFTESDVAVAGYGSAELQYFVGETRVKSETWRTRTDRGLNNAGATPDPPAENWLNTMLELGTETQENAQAAQMSEQSAQENAQAAQMSAQNAEESESQAQEHMATAKEQAELAQGAAETAELAKDAAAESEINAEASAQAATAKAHTATTMATEAVGSAAAAAAKAAEAEAAASGAKESESSAQQSAQSAAAAAGAAAKEATDNVVALLETQVSAAESAHAAAEGAAAAAQSSADDAAGSANSASNSAAAAAAAVEAAESTLQVYVSEAEAAEAGAKAAQRAAEAAKEAAEAAKDAASDIVGGDFASRTEAQGYAATAEANANKYTDQQIAAIPAPDVSGQIQAHNTSAAAHSDIRNLVSKAQAAADNAKTTAMEYADQQIAAIPTPDVSGQIGTHNSDGNAHGDIRATVSAAQAAANHAKSSADSKVSKAGDTMTGAIQLQPDGSDGYGTLHKNANADGDYGTQLQDTDPDGNFVGLAISGKLQRLEIEKKLAGEGECRRVNLYDEDNPPSAREVGALPAEGGELTGALDIASEYAQVNLKVSGGHSSTLMKSADGDNDNGTILRDTNGGNVVELKLSASEGSLKFAKGGNEFRVYTDETPMEVLAIEEIRSICT